MDNRKIFIYIAIMLIISSCGKLKNPKERNVISFKNNIDSVAFAIERMNDILDRSDINNYFFYSIDNNILYVKGVTNKSLKAGNITDTLLYKSEALSLINNHRRKEFVKLLGLLNQNYLDRCDYESGNYIYLYRNNIYMADRQKDLQRFVVFAKDKDEIKNLLEDNFVNAAHGGKYNLAYKIIDQKENLFLLAHKDAEIWEN